MGFLDFSGLTRFKEHLDTLFSNKLSTSLKGAANGVAELDASGKVPSSQLPSYVDDVLEFSTYSDFPVEGETGKIYVDLGTNISYRWSGSTYVKVASDLALGETSSTAYRGDRGASAYTHAVTNKGSAFANGLYKITTNEEGHVTAATAVQTNDITALGIATKDQDAIEGNFAAFDDEGNPVDSGHKHSDYITSHQDISGKLDKTYETLSSFDSEESLKTILSGVITSMPNSSRKLVRAACVTSFGKFYANNSYFFEISKGGSDAYATVAIAQIAGAWAYHYLKSGDTWTFEEFKKTQTAVSDPTADGTGVTFIDSVSQNTQGVISPHKKTVRTFGAASASTNGSTGLVPAPSSGKQSMFLRGDATWSVPTDTRNTAGSTDSSNKLFLIGAESQGANPQTYSHDTAFVGTDGCLYSDGTKVLTAHQDISGKKNTQTAVSDPSASGTSVTFISTISQNTQGVITPTKKTVSTMSAASASANGSSGLVPAPGSGKQGMFLRGDATWATPTNTTYADFTAATSSTAGVHGLVPAPGSGKQGSFLRGDKTWAEVKVPQTAVSDPSADGTSATFIATISQNAQGVISATKKTVRTMGAATASANGSTGLVPAPGSGKQGLFLRGDATWATPTNTTYADFTGATSSAAGAHGLVPAPASGKQNSFLRGDKTWAVPTNTTYATMGAASASANGSSGLVPAPGSGKQGMFLRGDATWATPTNTTYADFTAATSAAAGAHGLVPAPGSGKQASFLRGDKTWAIPTNTTYANATESAAGLMSTGSQILAGDKTFTGLIKNNNGTSDLDITKSNNGISSDIGPLNYRVIDKNGYYVAALSAYAKSDGIAGAQISARNKKSDGTTDAYNVFRIMVDKSGASTYSVSSPANFRSAIGVNGMGAASASANGSAGLVPAPGSGKQGMFLRGDATWATPTNTTYADFTGATSAAAGAHGLVPAPGSGKQASFLRGDKTWSVPTDTKNTAGSTNSSKKLFLIGAESQAANPQTYSQDTAYVGTDGCLYSGGTKVLTAHQDISGKKNTQSTVSDPAADGTSATFIATISQNAQGVITPTKKTVRTMGAASASANGSTGLVPAPGSGKQGLFLRGDATWQTPTNTTYADFTAATSSANGAHGLVPAPGSGKQGYFLRGDKTWAVPTNTTYANASTSAAGLVSTGSQTFAGAKTFQDNSVNISFPDVNLTKSNNGISSGTVERDFVTRDSNGYAMAIHGCVVSSDGTVLASLGTRNHTGSAQTSWKGITVVQDKAGTVTYSVTTPANFRSAIGVNAMGAASASANGSSGLVPAPGSGKQGMFLRGDATWATPTNTTYADFTAATASAAGAHGLVPAPGSGKQASFLRGDKTWAVPTNTTYADFTAATASAAGAHGLVPAPGSGKQASFLRGDKTWAVPTNTTYADFTAATSAAAGAHGLVPAPGKGKQASFLRGDKTWATPTVSRINGNLGAVSDTDHHYLWVSSSTTAADGVPKYISGVTITGSKVLYVTSICCSFMYSPDYTWHVGMQSDGNLVVYNGAGQAKWSTGTSTKHVKENIKSIEKDDLEKFMQIRTVSFNYRPEMNMLYNDKHYGVIAEELLDTYPNLVEIPENYDETKFDINKGFDQPLISVDYEQFIPLLIKMVQNQQLEINALKEQLSRRK